MSFGCLGPECVGVLVHIDARQLDAHHRQPVVPVDLRQQRLSRHWLGAFPILLFAVWLCRCRHAIPLDAASPVPMIGASGAIGDVMGMYIVLYPRVHVLVFLGVFLFTFTIPSAKRHIAH